MFLIFFSKASDYLSHKLNYDITDTDDKNTTHLPSSLGHVRPALTVHPSLCYSSILTTGVPH